MIAILFDIMRRVAKLLLIVAIVLVPFFILGSLLQPKRTAAETASATTPPIQATATASTLAPKWEYESVKMDAGSKTERLGCIESDEMLRFPFPYHDNYARLCFRGDGSVIFSVAEGQIMSGDEHHSRIRIGAGEPSTFELESSTDDDATVAFIDPSRPLFAAARAGKKIAVEATFYDAGVQTAIFSPDSPLAISSPHRAKESNIPSVCKNGGC